MGRKLPLGVQDFEKLRTSGCLYVDKTRFIHSLIQNGFIYFLSRPRRFGKSLFLSTMKYYFLSRRDLFKGLEIEELVKDEPDGFAEYPVFYFDFNGANYWADGAMESKLDAHLSRWEKEYGTEYLNKADPSKAELGLRFEAALMAAHKKTGKRVVILVDEYDKPLLDVMEDKSLLDHNRAVYKGFFSVLKSCDEHIHFAFITGVTKFTKVSLFSDLNNLTDISMDIRYASICGMTEEDLRVGFTPEIEGLAGACGLSVEECYAELKRNYDGYHFHPKAKGIYNPVSLLNCLQSQEFGSYWFGTATPTILIEKLQKSGFDLRRLTDKSLDVPGVILSNYSYDSDDPIPLLYQTGYLTLCGYNVRTRMYTLIFPNQEVESSFLECLLPYVTFQKGNPDPLSISSFLDDVAGGNLDGLKNRFIALFARLPYDTDERPLERNFQNAVYITFMFLGQYVKAEQHSALGRADVVVETDGFVYVFEFKRDGTAKEALEQIEKMGYALPYAADGRKLYKIGVSFSSKEKNIVDWECEEG